jgi:cytochrome c553
MRQTLVFAAAAAALAAFATAPARAQDSLQARSLAATCANCHGTDGRATGAMPVLAGMPAERMLATLADFRSGTRPTTVMQQIVKGYDDQQLKTVAAYFAARQTKR